MPFAIRGDGATGLTMPIVAVATRRAVNRGGVGGSVLIDPPALLGYQDRRAAQSERRSSSSFAPLGVILTRKCLGRLSGSFVWDPTCVATEIVRLVSVSSIHPLLIHTSRSYCVISSGGIHSPELRISSRQYASRETVILIGSPLFQSRARRGFSVALIVAGFSESIQSAVGSVPRWTISPCGSA